MSILPAFSFFMLIILFKGCYNDECGAMTHFGSYDNPETSIKPLSHCIKKTQDWKNELQQFTQDAV